MTIQGAAVLKHAISKRYLPIFSAKTGSTSPTGQVSYVDGYAGPGEYADGSGGSPVVALESLARQRVAVAGHFVEERRASFESLEAFLRGQAPGWHAHRGRVEDHLDSIHAAIPEDEPASSSLTPSVSGSPPARCGRDAHRLGRGAQRRRRVASSSPPLKAPGLEIATRSTSGSPRATPTPSRSGSRRSFWAAPLPVSPTTPPFSSTRRRPLRPDTRCRTRPRPSRLPPQSTQGVARRSSRSSIRLGSPDPRPTEPADHPVLSDLIAEGARIGWH